MVVSACSGDDNNNGGDSCSVALTGAVTSTITCTAAVGAYTSATNQSAVSVLASGSTPGLALALAFPGTLHTGTYHSTDAGAAGGITVTQGQSSWLAVAGTGTYTVNLTTVSTLSSTAQGTSYLIHGTIDATLVAAAQGAASVTLHATF